MQVYKAYFQIMRKHIRPMILFFALFVGLSVMITNQLGGGGEGYMQVQSKIALFNDDAGSALSDGLAKYIADNAEVVNIRDNEQNIKDALFYGNISYALRIPAGFSDDFLSRGDMQLEKTTGPNALDSVQMDMLVNRYMNIAAIYAANAQQADAAEIAEDIARDLEVQADLSMADNGSQEMNYMTYFFQFLAYAIMGIIIMGVTSFMMSMSKEDIIKRNLCSPVRPLSMNMQIVLGNAVFALVIWAALCLVIFNFCDGIPNGPETVLLCMNALALVIASLSIGFFAGKFIKNTGAQNAFVNIVALGSSFICGVFVEQEFLGRAVLNIARFLPTYWYVKAIDEIRTIAVFNFENVLPVIYSMLIQLGFAALILIVALVLSKQKKLQKES